MTLIMYNSLNNRSWVFIKKGRKNKRKLSKWKRKKSKIKSKYIQWRRLRGFIKTKDWSNNNTFFKLNKINLLLRKKLKKKLIKKSSFKLKRKKFLLKKSSLYIKKFLSKELRFVSEPLITFSPDINIKYIFWEKRLFLKKTKIKKPKPFFKKKKKKLNK